MKIGISMKQMNSRNDGSKLHYEEIMILLEHRKKLIEVIMVTCITALKLFTILFIL